MLSLVTSLVLACGTYGADPTLISQALDGSAQAIAELRAGGQYGLDELIERYQALGKSDPRWEAMIDKVAGQRYAVHSGLFWHTDLEAAKAEAEATGRGIVSLRMLGRLDEDLSCANSRYFRTMLYPDRAIGKALRQNFVLHWQPVREAPVITVDFGGGRKLVRTITGNSLHYVLSARGEVVDVMPGIVAPATFVSWLEGAAPVARGLAHLEGDARRTALNRHLAAQRGATLGAWSRLTRPSALKGPANPVEASPELFERLARVYPVTLSSEARELVTRLMPDMRVPEVAGYRPDLARRAMPIAIGKAAVEMPMLDRLAPVLANLGRDDLKNRFELRLRVLELADRALEQGVLTAAIYEEVFLTPLDDPWMGLAPSDVFTGLPAEVERAADTVGEVGGLRRTDALGD